MEFIFFALVGALIARVAYRAGQNNPDPLTIAAELAAHEDRLRAWIKTKFGTLK